MAMSWLKISPGSDLVSHDHASRKQRSALWSTSWSLWSSSTGLGRARCTRQSSPSSTTRALARRPRSRQLEGSRSSAASIAHSSVSECSEWVLEERRELSCSKLSVLSTSSIQLHGSASIYAVNSANLGSSVDIGGWRRGRSRVGGVEAFCCLNGACIRYIGDGGGSAGKMTIISTDSSQLQSAMRWQPKWRSCTGVEKGGGGTSGGNSSNVGTRREGRRREDPPIGWLSTAGLREAAHQRHLRGARADAIDKRVEVLQVA
eukprot:877475-Rhodomonas_salina.1